MDDRIRLRQAAAHVRIGRRPTARYAKADQRWKIELGPNASAAAIRDRFSDVFAITGIPRDAALFSDATAADSEVVYFSPTAAILASFLLEATRGRPCDRPAEGALLVGRDEDRELLPAPA
jgi:hypothetical protein